MIHQICPLTGFGPGGHKHNTLHITTGTNGRNSSAANGLAIADYVVVGTGLAGSVIAERLSADPGARYLGR